VFHAALNERGNSALIFQRTQILTNSGSLIELTDRASARSDAAYHLRVFQFSSMLCRDSPLIAPPDDQAVFLND
jgi:hypothetical protein